MKRSMMQIYIKDSRKALEFYKKAFDAKIVCEHLNEEGTYMHAELDVYGQILALSEQINEKPNPGNTMQFCLHLGEGNADKVHQIFEVLKEDAELHGPVGDSGWSKHMFSLVDKFGVNWCIFE